MPASTQLLVALELDFPEKLVRRALHKLKFATAGDLCDYIDTHTEELEVEAKEEEEKQQQQQQEEAEEKKRREEEEEDAKDVGAAMRELTLTEETELLYKQSRCAVCRENKRCFVTLPCSHLTLCLRCEPKTRHCPLPDCQQFIECTIQTYGF